MIGLGLRLVISGGREAVVRFLVLAAAVGLGVGLLLTAVAATNAVTTWNNSHAWLWTATTSVPPGPATTGIAPLWWHPSSDIFDGRNIYRFDVAATGASSPVPPGIRRDPGPGQYYASPALAALLRSTPADELGDRYPGHLAGVIGDAALSSPDSLVIIVGHTPAQLAGTPGSAPVTSIATTLSRSFSGQANPTGLHPAQGQPGRHGGGHGDADRDREDVGQAERHVGSGGQPVPISAGVISCAQLASVPALGRCPAGATAAAFPEDGFDGPLDAVTSAGVTWPAVNVPAARLDTLGVDAISVATNGSVPAIERARTVLENAPGYSAPVGPSTIGDLISQDNSANDAYQQLANTVILVSLPIAGCTLAAAIAAGLADRKRPFSLLRLTGARLATLRRVVALESALPLLAVAAVAIGTGFAAAAEYASVAQHHSMVAPGAAYYLLAAGGILVSLGIIAATFPLLKRITGPEVARNE